MSQTIARPEASPDSKSRAAWIFRVLGVEVAPGQGKGADGLRKRLADDLLRLKALADQQVEGAAKSLIGSINHEIDAGDAGAALPLLGKLEQILDAAERKKNSPPPTQPQPKDPKQELLAEIDDLMRILETTGKQVAGDAKQFGGFLHLDDIVLSGGIKTGEKTRLLKLIDGTIATVLRGRETFVTPARQLEEQIAQSQDPEVTKRAGIQATCTKTVNFWESLIPEGIWSEASLIKDRIAALTTQPKSPEQDKLVKGAEQKIAGLKSQVDEFKQIVESHSSRSFARTDPFATRMLTSLSPDEEKKLRAMQDELARAGQVFLDATVSIDKLNEQGLSGDQRDTRYDFQALYDKIVAIGLPEVWWPPRLVERVQAWRKASRVHTAHNLEQTSTAKEIGGEILGAFGQLMKLGSLGGAIANFDASFKPEDSSAPPEPDKSAQRIATMMGSICELTGGLKENVKGVLEGGASEALRGLKEALSPDEQIDLQERLARILTVVEKPVEFCTQAMDLVTNVGKYAGTPWAKAFDTKVVPGLSLAVHILKLANAINEAAKSAMLTSKTQRLGTTSDQQNATGLRQDGGATTASLEKAVTSQKEFTARKGLEVFVESTQVTAQAVVLSGVSAPAGYGLAAVASGIELAGEVVFDTIDWSHAKVAKKLLQDARAGSPTAQQLLFEKCELYSKLYLAILVREGDPLGKKYIVDRGITQDSLDKPTSIWLLGEALRGAVQKEDDTEIDDNLAKHLAGPLGKLAGRIGDAVVDGVSSVVEAGRQALSSDYDPNWTAPKTPSLDPAVWTEIKDSAVDDGGLRNDSTGITDGLKVLKKTTEEYDALGAPPKSSKKGQQPPSDQDKLKAVSRVLQQAGVVAGLMSGFRPVQGKSPTEEHAPMRGVLNEMHKLLTALGNKYKGETANMQGVSLGAPDQDGNRVLDIPQTGWTGLARGGKCQEQWDRTWQAALNTIGLADEDFGASKLLGKVQEQWDPLRELEGQSQIVNAKSGGALYKARKGTLDALKSATDAMARCEKAVALFPNLAAFVTAARNDMATRTRAIDDQMCGARVSVSVDTKPALPDHDPKSTAPAFQRWAAMWLSSWKHAAELGFCSADGGDKLSVALNAFGSGYAAYLAAAPGDKSRPGKRDTALGEGAKALKACDALIRAEPYAPDAILGLVRAYAKDVVDGRTRLVDEVSKTVVLDPRALADLQNAVPGKVDPAGKGLIAPNELKGPWEKAYAECLTKGVAAKSDSGAALGKQLGALKTAMEEANKLLATGKCAAKDLPDLYKGMDDIRKKITEAIKLVNKLLAAPGFAANDQIMDLLSVLGAEFSNYLAVIEDRKGKIEVSGGTVDADIFSKVKNMFIKQGLAPGDDTGLSELIKKAKGAKSKDRGTAMKALRDKIDETIRDANNKVAASKQPQPPQTGKKKAPPPVELNYQPWINYLTEVKAQAV